MTTGIKQFTEDFLNAEAISFDTRTKIKDLQEINAAFNKMHSYTVPELEGMLGQIYLSELRDDSYYESNKSNTDSIPRYLFKISRYKHPKYNDVWIAYTSPRSPDADFPTLSNAFFIVKEDGAFKVGSHSVYSNKRGMSYAFDWEWMAGIKELTFDNLTVPEEIERYREPFDVDYYLKLYLADI